MRLEEIYSTKSINYMLYVDLDNTLVDFDGGIKKLFGESIHQISTNQMWRTIYATPNFFYDLEWSRDGKRLWQYIARYHPTILTGLPAGNPKDGLSSVDQKKMWVKKYLGSYVPCIVVKSIDKQMYADENSILIDDRADNINQWKSRGGIGIQFFSLQNAVKQLRDLGL